MSKRFRLGQSLIEVVVSLGVAVILAVSLISTSLITQKTARAAKNNSQATKLAQESIEKIRVFRDRIGFNSLAVGLCLVLNSNDQNPLNWTLKNCIVNTDESLNFNNTNFTRKIEIDDSGVNAKLVTVTVTWNEPGGTQAVKQQTFLSKWQTP